ncbi:Tfp pilus assembly protein PilE [Legionella massiliensis]|uniref:Tfp pilus assembly protein PilE n=1 Tax=Legionella massiliensis TaxID=1034943 RepID=A0A078L412_9GAMM|nr:type IV pilin protein [Legionella massiliensis]CDZ78673.1 Tfp pilus assembly protein PilE [Legionella massiliensis]CEE14411.1 Fimbrial protein precursor [Legionella massiliensis]
MKTEGFSLIELMFVIIIVGILTTFTYPIFQEAITRSRRIDGQTSLIDLASRMERYFAENHSYQGATLGTGTSTDILASKHSSQSWYILAIVEQTDSSFNLEAIPTKAQAINDKACQTLGLNNLGIKTVTAGPGGLPTAKADICW